VEVVSSNNVASGTAILVDAAALAVAFDLPMFDISQVATVIEANADGTAPTMADDGAGAIGTAGQVPAGGGIPLATDAATATPAVGYTARSLWQTYSEGIRGIWPTSWTLMRSGAVAYMTAVLW